MGSDPNDWRDIRDRYKNGHAAVILPKNVEAPAQMMMTIQKGLLTIEFDRQVGYLQFSKSDAARFIEALVTYYNLMEKQDD